MFGLYLLGVGICWYFPPPPLDDDDGGAEIAV
jgi:hypothetical protein